MHLGLTGIPLILRTALPAAALAILVGKFPSRSPFKSSYLRSLSW